MKRIALLLIALTMLTGCAAPAVPATVTVTVTPATGLSADEFYNKVTGSTSGVPTAPVKTTPAIIPPTIATPAKTTATPTNDDIVYITKTGTKYHRAGCRYLSSSSIPIARSEAIKKYGACSVCNP